MRVRGRGAPEPRKNKQAKADKPKSPRNWKKIGITFGVVFGMLLLLFCVLVFNPFEGGASEFTLYVPRGVDFFLLKKDLAEDLNERPEPHFMPKVRDTQAWKNFLTSNDFDEQIVQGGLEQTIDEMMSALESAPIDVIANLVGEEFLFAGRSREDAQAPRAGSVEQASFLKQTQAALYFRVSWKVKLGYRVLSSSLLRGWFAPDLEAESVDDHVRLSGLQALDGVDLWIWRDRDMLVVTNDESFLQEIKGLSADEDTGASDSFKVTTEYGIFEREKTIDAQEGDSTAYWILRPRGLLQGLGIDGPIPKEPGDPESSQADRFLGQLISTEFMESIIGYSRARTDPLGRNRNESGLRVRGSIKMKLADVERTPSAEKDPDSGVNIESDRDRMFALQLGDELRIPPYTDTADERSIELLSGLIPEDVAIWTYLAGDLRALFRIFERSFPPVGHPGEDWDRDIINEQFAAALEGLADKAGYNEEIEAIRNSKLSSIAGDALREATSQLGPGASQARIEATARAIEARMKRALPARIEVGQHGRAFRSVLEHLGAMLGKSRGRPGTTGAQVALGRAMFLLRKNDYGDLREGLPPNQLEYIPAFYADRVDDPSPAWAFVFWIDDADVQRVDATMKAMMDKLPWENEKTYRVEITKEGVGQRYAWEYWSPDIPGPGEIVTAFATFLEETSIERLAARSSRSRRRAASNRETTLFIVSNHLKMVEDLVTAAVKPHQARLPNRLRDDVTFGALLRSEIDQPSNLFAYWNGAELARIREMSIAREARRQAEIQLDTDQVRRELFGQAARELGLQNAVRPGLTLEQMWRLVPGDSEDQMDKRIFELRESRVRKITPEVRGRLNLRAAYPALFRAGVLSLQTVSQKPPKFNLQLGMLFDLKPRG